MLGFLEILETPPASFIPIMCGGGGGPSHRCEPWPRCDEGAFWTRDSKLAAATVGPFTKKCDPWPECLKDGSRGQSSPLDVEESSEGLMPPAL